MCRERVLGWCISQSTIYRYGDILLEWFIITNLLRDALDAGIFRRTIYRRDIEGQRRNQIIITKRQLYVRYIAEVSSLNIARAKRDI